MKFNRFLSHYERTSTSLTQGLAPVSNPDVLNDQSFSHRQAIDKNRRHVKRYTESEIVQDSNVDVRRSIVSERRAARKARQVQQAQELLDALGGPTARHAKIARPATPQVQRPASSAATPAYRFTEPASRPRPM